MNLNPVDPNSDINAPFKWVWDNSIGQIPILSAPGKIAQGVAGTGSLVPQFSGPEKGSGKLPGGFGTWLVGMVALGGVLLLMSDSEKYSQMAVALTAVIAVAVAFKWGQVAIIGVDETFGTSFGSHKA